GAFAPRVAACEADGAAAPQAVENKAVIAQLELDPTATFAEQGARLHAIGDLKVPGQSGAVLTLLKQVPLDAPPEIQYGAEWAAARLDPSEGVKGVTLRIRKKYVAGLPVVTEINLLGDLPPAEAAPALVDAAQLTLNDALLAGWHERLPLAVVQSEFCSVDPRRSGFAGGQVARRICSRYDRERC